MVTTCSSPWDYPNAGAALLEAHPPSVHEHHPAGRVVHVAGDWEQCLHQLSSAGVRTAQNLLCRQMLRLNSAKLALSQKQFSLLGLQLRVLLGEPAVAWVCHCSCAAKQSQQRLAHALLALL